MCVPGEMACKPHPSGPAALTVGSCWPRVGGRGFGLVRGPCANLGTKGPPGPFGQLRSLQQNHAVRPRPGPSADVLGMESLVFRGDPSPGVASATTHL